MENKEACPIKKTSIGGQALIEGVMMRGPEKTAMAVRHTSGEIRMEEWENTESTRPAVTKWPFIRGIFSYIDSMSVGYKCLMRSAELSGMEEELEEKPAEKEKKSGGVMNAVMVAGTVLGVALALVLFMWLPIKLFQWTALLVPGLDAETPGYGLIKAVFEGVARLAIFLGYMVAVSRMKDIRRTFQYHGAEHKSIFCYEKGLPLTVENVRAQSRFHPRCGTSFLVLMLLVGILISMFIPIENSLLRTAVKLALLPVTVGIGYELIKLAGRKDNWFTRVISAPGLWMQRLTTIEPEDAMIECAIASLEAVIPADGESDKW